MTVRNMLTPCRLELRKTTNMTALSLDGGFWSTDKYVSSLGKSLKIRIMQNENGPPTKRQMDALQSIDRLPAELPEDIAAHAVPYFHKVDDVVGLADEGVHIDVSKIENHYQITSLLIPLLREADDLFLLFSADCNWEPEHGMQLILENGRVIGCGPQSSLAFGAAWERLLATPAKSRKKYLDDILH